MIYLKRKMANEKGKTANERNFKKENPGADGVNKENRGIIKIAERRSRRWLVEIAANMQDQEVVKKIVEIDKVVHSIVYTREFLNVVEGFIDGYVVLQGKGHPWDYAPRALFLKEAGMKVTNADSDDYDYTVLSLVAAHPKVHAKLASILSPQA